MSNVNGAAFHNLEPRRLMSGSAPDAPDNSTLLLDADGDGPATMSVELDADATHVRGLVNGRAGQWMALQDVRRVQVTGGDGHDQVEIDSRLHRAGATLAFSSVEAVEVRVVLDAKNYGGRTQMAEVRQMRDAVMKVTRGMQLTVQSMPTERPETQDPAMPAPPTVTPVPAPVPLPVEPPVETPPPAVDDPDFTLYWGLMNTVPDSQYPVADVRTATLGGHTVGLYPEISDGVARNGGTPIGLDLDAHLAQLATDLARLTHDSGSLIALDFEVWGPTMPDSGPYYDLAMQQMAQRRPDLAPAALEAAARAQWQANAVAFFEGSIDVAQATRPDLKWGFYYPQARHYWNGAYSGEAAEARQAENDLLAATWAKVDWFPVSVYWFYPTTAGGDVRQGEGTVANNRRYIADNVSEWIRLAGGPSDERPVIAMIEPRIHHSNQVYGGQPVSRHDLDLIMSEAHRSGADGLLVWGWVPGNAEGVARAEEINSLFAPIADAYSSLMESLGSDEAA